MDVSPLNLGMIAAYYYINYTTIGKKQFLITFTASWKYWQYKAQRLLRLLIERDRSDVGFCYRASEFCS